MIHLLCFLLPPTAALLLSLFIEKKRAVPAPASDEPDTAKLPFLLIRWALLAVALYILTALILVPLDRATVCVAWTGIGIELLYIRFGTTAMLFSALLALLAGVSIPSLRRTLGITGTAEAPGGRRRSPVATLLLHGCVLLLLFLTFALIWSLCNYGNISMDEILFHLSISLKGTSRDILLGFLLDVILPTAVAFAFFELLVHAPAKRSCRIQSRRLPALWVQAFPLRASALVGLLGIIGWFCFLVVCADQSFSFFDFVRSQLKTSDFIEQEYVDPRDVSLVFPEQKRNLITLYVESAETSSQDAENGGFFETNYIPEMTRIARENVSFSHSQKLEGAAIAPACGWTIAGLVAQTTGLPLKMANNERWNNDDSDLQGIDWFLSGATSLGDLLKENGYRTVFMAGSDFAFGGRLQYYTQHGQYEILDYNRALEDGVIPPDYYVHWGFEDRRLYSWAKEALTELSRSDQPFHFSMLTVDTHNPAGYLCDLCPDIYPTQFENVLACSSRQLDDFITWCEAQPFFENTSIVITGDHGSMVPGFYQEGIMDCNHGTTNRKVYNAFINSAVEPVQEENRRFTTLDFFPTTLASIGVSIEGERLGLGTNLFSAVPTLAEEYGYQVFFDELNLKSPFFIEHILGL